MNTLPTSVKITRTIAYIVVGFLGGWLAYLGTNAYWVARGKTEILDPLEVSASLGLSTIVGAAVMVCALWSFYDRPVRHARRQERLRLGSSRFHRSRV